MKLLSGLNATILELLCSSEEGTEGNIALEVGEAGKYEQEMRNVIGKIERSVKTQDGDAQEFPTPVGMQTMQKARVRLPKLEIRKFNGTLHQWQEFWDCYESSIHKNESLSEIDKFTYLKSLLEGSAKSAIAGFSLTAVNYKEAIKLLQNRYGQRTMIQRSHVNELLNVSPRYNAENDPDSLRAFYDCVESHHRGLQAMKVDEGSYSSIVVPALVEKLPTSLRLTITRDQSNFLEWTTTEFLKQLLKEVELRERHQLKLTASDWKKKQPQGTPSSASALFAGKNDHRCAFCLGDHSHEECTKVMDIRERKNIARKYARCFNCLRKNHKIKDCTIKVECSNCKGSHHLAFCSNPKRVDKESNPVKSPSSMHVRAGSKVALQTAQAYIRGGRSSKCLRVLFDSGSQRSFITSKVVETTGLNIIRNECLGIKTFGNESKQTARDVVEIRVGPVGGKEFVLMEAYVVPEISHITNDHLEVVKKNHSHLKNLWLSDVCKNQDKLEIELLIGADFLWRFQKGKIIRGGPTEPVAIETLLGWVLSGPLTSSDIEEGTAQVNLISQDRPTDNLERDLGKLWDLDSIGIREVDEVHEGFLDEITFNGSRYSVKLPWKIGREDLPTNYTNSLTRLRSLGNKLRKTPDILEEYKSVIEKQLETGVIEKVSKMDISDKTHYLPHHAVVRREAKTTKVRVVYDASSKDTKSSASLNDCLHVGPSLNPLLFNILLRFRTSKVVLIADIEKAFLNVEIEQSDRDSLRFLWMKDPKDIKSPVEVYRFCRVVFGLNASPFLLNGTIRHHLSQWKIDDPEFVIKMEEGFYVDDLVTGEDSVEEAFVLYNKAKRVMGEGGFNLRKWISNDVSLKGRIDRCENMRLVNLDEGRTDDESYAKSLLGTQNTTGTQKVLGQSWDCTQDILSLNFAEICDKADNLKLTKRNLLSLLAGLFDPLGIISPVVVCMKMLLQEVCRQNKGWDEELTGGLKKTCDKWIANLKKAREIRVYRHVFDGVSVKECLLHGFADASKGAYSAVVYLVYYAEAEGTWKSNLLTSKTRVAPVKTMTIPRLELMGARILSQLVSTVKTALSSQVKINATHLWTDSLTVLYWLQNKGEWKQFVKCRVNEILKLSHKADWRHCPGEVNPADLGSRGVHGIELKESKLWWEGPPWITSSMKDWPSRLIEKTEECTEEEKKTVVMVVRETPTENISSVMNIENYSDASRLFKVTAWVLRFVNNLTRRNKGKDRTVGVLQRSEIFQAEQQWVKVAQTELRGQSNYKQLSSKFGLKEDGEILKCYGRLGNSDLGEEASTPIILPKNHRLTTLIVIECHRRIHHSGTRSTLAELRSRFWVPKGRQLVKKVLGKCVVCKRWEGRSYSAPASASLPSFRVQQAEPFTRTGVDFAGPIYVKGALNETVKEYVALFTCCITRAVHLDLVQDLNAQTFRRCLRRFTARRGCPALMVSDNAKTFQATEKALNALYNHPEIQAELSIKRIDWRFNLERAPWWGGFFERMVGTMKRCLRKTLGKAKLSHDEMLTVLVEVENTLNARPLTYSYEDSSETVLTPSHLICGRRLVSMPDEVVEPADEVEVDLNARFKYISTKLQHIWTRWRREYLTDLREFHNSNTGSEERMIKMGDVVVVFDEEKKRGQWNTGIVEGFVTGSDEVVRGAKVRVIKKGKPKYLSRPLQKLYPLEINSSVEGHREPSQPKVTPTVRRNPRRNAAIQARDKIGEMFNQEINDNYC